VAVLVFALTLLLLSLFRARHSRSKIVALLFISVPLGVLLTTSFVDSAQIFGRSAFAYDDLAGRGVNSGFTGRVLIWEKALVVIADHPALGVGPRLGPNYLDGWSLHNGYLQVLMECGGGGAAALFCLLVGLTGSTMRRAGKGEPVARTALALAFAYFSVAIFEARILNAGNPTSIIFWILLLNPRQDAKTASLWRPTRFARNDRGLFPYKPNIITPATSLASRI